MTDYTPIPKYVPIQAEIVTCRLTGKEIPPYITLAQQYPCAECGAPAGMACTGQSALCWRARLFREDEMRDVWEAWRLGARGVNFRDMIYQGLSAMGRSSHVDPIAVRVRSFVPDELKVIELLILKKWAQGTALKVLGPSLRGTEPLASTRPA